MAMNEKDKVLMNVGLAVAAYFVVVRPLLSAVGIDPQSQANIESINMLDPAKNPFDMNYDGGVIATGAAVPDPKTWFSNMKFIGDAQGAVYNSAASGISNVYAWSEAINNAFHWYNTDIDAVKTVFNQVRSKADIADISGYLNYNYNTNLWTLLNTGASWIPFSQAGIPIGDLSQIINHVNNLPNE